MPAMLKVRFPHCLVPLAAAVVSCSGEGPSATGGDAAEPTGAAAAGLEWRKGEENSYIAHRGEEEVVRCWNVQGRYDCLAGQSIGLKRLIPGAPDRLAFFRFGATGLPAGEEELDRLAVSDGYACELTRMPDKAVMTETYWQGGQVTQERATAGGDTERWSAEQVAAFGQGRGRQQVRSYFLCDKVIEPVLDVGLFALDSSLIRYDMVFSAVDYPVSTDAR